MNPENVRPDAGDAQGAVSGRDRARARRLAGGMLLLCLAATCAAWWGARDRDMAEAKARFERQGEEVVFKLRERLQAYSQILRGAAGLVSASDEVTRQEWLRYVTQLDLNRQYPGIQGVGFAVWIKPGEAARQARVPVTYLEPMTWRNERALGFDMYSEPVRRVAIAHAVDAADIGLSGRVTLVQETAEEPQPGFLMYFPIYARGTPPASTDERRARVLGFAFAPFRMNDLMGAMLSRGYEHLAIRIRDDTGRGGAESLLFDSLPAPAGAPAFALRETIHFGGHTWHVDMRSKPDFEAGISRARSNLLLGSGLLLSLLFTLLTWSLASARGRAEVRAQAMTEALRTTRDSIEAANSKLRAVLDASTEVALIATDTAGLVTTFNRGAERMLGYDAQEVIGRQTPAAFHESGEVAARGAELTAQFGEPVGGFEVFVTLPRLRGAEQREWTYVRKDGSTLKVSLVVTAVRGAAGEITGYLGVAVDITERTLAEQRFERYRAFLRRVLDVIPDPVIVKDTAHRFVMANRAFAELVGRPEHEIIGRTTHELFPESAARAAMAADRQALAGGETAEQDVVLFHAGRGEMRNMIVKKAATLGPEGEPVVVGIEADVTELRKALARFEAVIEETPLVGVIGVERDGTIRYWNRAAEDFYGYDRRKVAGRRLQDLLEDPADARLLMERLEAVWENGLPAPLREAEIRLRNGAHCWVLSTLFPVMFEGKVVEVFSMAANISARHASEQALQTSEQRFRHLSQLSSDWFWEQDAELRFTEMTGGLEKGYIDLPKVLGKRRDELPVDRESADWAGHFALLDAHRPFRDFEYRVEGQEGPGDWRWYSISGDPLFDADGRFLGYRGVGKDVTERKRDELRMRQLSEAVRQSPVSIVITDTQGRIEYVNPKFERLTGYALAEVAGQNPRLLKSGETPPEQYARLWRTVLAGGEWQGEFHNRKKNGEFYWEHASISPIVDAKGRVTSLLAVKEDVTERKHIEAELERHRNHLQELVREQTEGLLQAKEAAERAYRAKSEFLANMSHELRTPMHAILSFAQIGHGKSGGDGKLHGYFERIRQSGERLLGLLDGLLDLSKLEAGRMALDIGRRDLAAIVREVAAELEPLMIARRIAFSQADGPAMAAVDAARFGQVVRNLLANAIKFTPEGRRIAVGFAPGLLPAGRRASDHGELEAVAMRVSDEGVGIPEAELETVFDKFVQSSKTKSGAGGTGLGLAICREIVEAHRGTIHAEPNAAGGADFVVVLAVAPHPLLAASNIPESAEALQ